MNQNNIETLLNCAFCEVDDMDVPVPRFSIGTMYDEEACDTAEKVADMILQHSMEPRNDGVLQAIVVAINYLSDKYNMEGIDCEFLFSIFVKGMYEQIKETSKSMTDIIMDSLPEFRTFTSSPSGKIIYLKDPNSDK